MRSTSEHRKQSTYRAKLRALISDFKVFCYLYVGNAYTVAGIPS
jgi:hypothetical protein